MAMSAQHKAALAQGRRESRAIKLYLEALANRRPGRPVTPASIEKRIRDLEAKIAAETDTLRSVDLRQARIEAEQALAKAEAAADMAELEKGFTKHAKAYSTRKGISYAAWREAGVPAAMLKQAGINRAG
jgi:hypothetical protein